MWSSIKVKHTLSSRKCPGALHVERAENIHFSSGSIYFKKFPPPVLKECKDQYKTRWYNKCEIRPSFLSLASSISKYLSITLTSPFLSSSLHFKGILKVRKEDINMSCNNFMVKNEKFAICLPSYKFLLLLCKFSSKPIRVQEI